MTLHTGLLEKLQKAVDAKQKKPPTQPSESVSPAPSSSSNQPTVEQPTVKGIDNTGGLSSSSSSSSSSLPARSSSVAGSAAGATQSSTSAAAPAKDVASGSDASQQVEDANAGSKDEVQDVPQLALTQEEEAQAMLDGLAAVEAQLKLSGKAAAPGK